MKTISAIASTTHLDRRGTRFSRDSLDGMVENIKNKYIPYTKDHDPEQLLGILLYGEVFQLEDGEYALGVVIGEYENDFERKKYFVGAENREFDGYQTELDIDSLRLSQRLHSLKPDPIKPIDPSGMSMADLLAMYLDYTRVNDDGQVYEIRQYITRTDGLEIHVFPKDHLYQEHYHVISKQRGINARFDARTHEIISVKHGTISKKDIKKIQAFFKNLSNAKLLKAVIDKMYK
jgi:hypothetical protein